MPTCPAVRSLYSLQNAIILTPCGPSAVPIGGAGLAFPAGICSFTTALTRFAILFHTPVYFTLIQPHARYNAGLDLLNLKEVQNDRSLTAEKRNQHRHLITIHIYIANSANKLGKWAINHTHTLAFSETDLRLGLLRLLRHLLQDRLDFMILKWNRPRARTNKTC